MFIQTEQTPNPASLKFLPGEPVLEHGSADFRSVEACDESPMAKRLFGFEGVEGVYLGNDFITVTKSDDVEWDTLKPIILNAIMEHYSAGQPIVVEGADLSGAGEGGMEVSEEDSEIVEQIKELIETRVRPAVAMDGGDILFHGFREGVVYLQMKGACQGCGSRGSRNGCRCAGNRNAAGAAELENV